MTQRRAAARPYQIIVLAIVGLGYATVASFTRPFTVGADVVTAIPLAVAVVVAVVRERTVGRPALASDPGSEPVPVPLTRWSLVWFAVAAAIVSWELVAFTSAPRRAHPTLSTLIDMLDSTHAGKTVAIALWLLLGCYLVRR